MAMSVMVYVVDYTQYTCLCPLLLPSYLLSSYLLPNYLQFLTLATCHRLVVIVNVLPKDEYAH